MGAHCIYFGDPAEIEQKILEKRTARTGWGDIIPKAIGVSRKEVGNGYLYHRRMRDRSL